MIQAQMSLPFPQPASAEPWPNSLGFDWHGLEFWSAAAGVRDLTSMTYGVGGNWVSALCDLLNSPKVCD